MHIDIAKEQVHLRADLVRAISQHDGCITRYTTASGYEQWIIDALFTELCGRSFHALLDEAVSEMRASLD